MRRPGKNQRRMINETVQRKTQILQLSKDLSHSWHAPTETELVSQRLKSWHDLARLGSICILRLEMSQMPELVFGYLYLRQQAQANQQPFRSGSNRNRGKEKYSTYKKKKKIRSPKPLAKCQRHNNRITTHSWLTLVKC